MELLMFATAWTLGGMYSLWVFYLAVMNLARAKRNGLLNKTALVLGTPLLVVGYLVDFMMNVTVMTVVLLEWPQETTVTARLKRHNKESTGWRLSIVKWFEPILDPYDPSGDHI